MFSDNQKSLFCDFEDDSCDALLITSFDKLSEHEVERFYPQMDYYFMHWMDHTFQDHSGLYPVELYYA